MTKILHVDDDESFRHLVAEYVKNYFHITIDSVTSGNEAKKKINEGHRYQLIISDLMMPDGNGNELFQFVNIHLSQAYFIFLTNSPHLVRVSDPNIFYCVIEKTEMRRLREKIELAIYY